MRPVRSWRQHRYTRADAQRFIDDWSGLVTQDHKFIRPPEVDLLVGDPTKAKERLGWEPKVGFEQLVRMMVRADLAELRAA